MSLIKRIGRAAPVQNALGMLAERYLRLVRRTNHFVVEPTEPNAWLDGLSPFIAGMWHGQHTMISFMRRPHDRIATIISRSADGNVNTITLTQIGRAHV